VRDSSSVRHPALGLILWLVALVVGAWPAAAAAQGQGSSQQLDAIRARMESGLALFVAGDHARAAAEFDAGYAQHPYSAFLFNAGVVYQKLGDDEKALERYREYLKVDPHAPDIGKVQERIAALEAARLPPTPAPPGPDEAPGSDEAPGPEGTPPAPAPPPVDAGTTTQADMRSLVVVETDPPGAPVRVYRALNEQAAPFAVGQANASWSELYVTASPTSLSLAEGRYHLVVEKFRDFNVSQTDIRVLAGHVHHFKANLSQGAFMSFLRVSANVKGARVWLDDPDKTRPEWGTTPYGELVPSGEHELLVEMPGFQPLRTAVTLEHGEQKEIEVKLVRVTYGILRVDANTPQIKVRVNEEPKGVWRSGENPLEIQVPAGKHKLTVESDGHKTLETMVVVPKGQVLPVHAKMIPKYPRGGAWTQGVLAATFIGAGVFFGLESNRLKDQIAMDREAGVLGDGDGRIMQGRLYAIGANVGFGVGAVLAVLSTYNFIKDPLPESTRELGKPAEFDDARAKRPTAAASMPGLPQHVRRPRPTPSLGWAAAPVVLGSSGGGLVVEGRF
jgi:tetratricopeptide (TPR) repeat protein